MPFSVRKINIKCATNGSQVSDLCPLGYLFLKTFLSQGRFTFTHSLPDCWSNDACSLGGQYIPLAVVLPEVKAALKIYSNGFQCIYWTTFTSIQQLDSFCLLRVWTRALQKHVHVMYTPLNPTFI